MSACSGKTKPVRSPIRFISRLTASGCRAAALSRRDEAAACEGSPLLTAAGLWDEWKDRATGERLKSCTMIVTDPNDFAAEIHDRMPVFLTEHQFAPWLSAEAGADYLKPAPNDYLQRWPVSKRGNSSRADADDLTLIQSI
jgi:putative SOS response-associated peptidase YedK